MSADLINTVLLCSGEIYNELYAELSNKSNGLFKMKKSDCKSITKPEFGTDLVTMTGVVKLFIENMQVEYDNQVKDFSDSDSTKGGIRNLFNQLAPSVSVEGSVFVKCVAWFIARYHMIKGSKTLSIDSLFAYMVMTAMDMKTNFAELAEELCRIKSIKKPKSTKSKTETATPPSTPVEEVSFPDAHSDDESAEF